MIRTDISNKRRKAMENRHRRGGYTIMVNEAQSVPVRGAEEEVCPVATEPELDSIVRLEARIAELEEERDEQARGNTVHQSMYLEERALADKLAEGLRLYGLGFHPRVKELLAHYRERREQNDKEPTQPEG